MSNIGSWALAAASNNATPPNGWPEGQAPSTVNNCAREMMSSIRTQWDDAVWFNFYSTTSPPVSLKAQNKIRISNQSAASTYTATAIYPTGTRLKVVNNNVVKYGTVISLSSSSTAVMLTMSMDSSTLTSTITTVSRSIITPGSNTPIPATASGWVKISSASAAASASITFTGLNSNYAAYKILITDVIPGTDNVEMTMRTSTNNGSSYDSGGSDYAWAFLYTDLVTTAAAVALGDNLDDNITLFNSMGSDTAEKGSFDIILFRPSSATQGSIWYSGTLRASNGIAYYMTGAGVRLASTDVDAIQFIMSSGTIASGIFTLYGLTA